MKKKFITVFSLLAIALTGCKPTETARRLTPDDYRVTYDAARSATGYNDMPTTGTAKVLILPVDFSDFPADNLPGGAENYRSYLEHSFFGDGTTTTWESLKSFYFKSSYGKLTIEGHVDPWYRYPKTAVELGNMAKTSGAGGTAASVLNQWWMDQVMYQYRDFTEFDGDGDGLIDAIFMVYSAPFFAKNPNTGEAINNDFFWAFRSSSSSTPDKMYPAPSNYMWASQEFMFDAGYINNAGVRADWTVDELAAGTAKPDAHTFIHETGHMLGLDDYYSYDTRSGDFGGMGGLDMMDYNIGDHNGYSKWMLGWLNPQMITGKGEVTLKPIAKEGDALIIPANWTGNVNSEYLLIDYYTPENLFAHDSQYHYSGNYPLFYSTPGVRVFHVDARTGYMRYVNGSYVFENYTDYVGAPGRDNFYGIVAANSTSRTFHTDSVRKQWKLMQMLENGGTTALERANAIATDSMLFHEGDTFGYDTFKDFRFHGGQKVPFKFEVTALTADYVTIKFA
jgi:M6 family metalloprotease-like protein